MRPQHTPTTIPAQYTASQIRSAKLQGMTVEDFVKGLQAIKDSIERGKKK